MSEAQETLQDLDALLRAYVHSMLRPRIITREELAKWAGLSRSGMTKWLMGHSSMTLRSASRLVSLLGFDRFLRFAVSHGAEPQQPELLDLLEQTTLTLRSLLEQQMVRDASPSQSDEAPTQDPLETTGHHHASKPQQA